MRNNLFWLLSLPFFLFGGGAVAQQTEDAASIVRKADEKMRGQTSIADMTITTVRPKWTRAMEIKTWTKGTEMALILIKSPAKDRGTAFLKRKKEVWNRLPALELDSRFC